jgi:hypothetical protein
MIPKLKHEEEPSRFRGWDYPDEGDADLRHLIEFLTQLSSKGGQEAWTGKEVAWGEVGRVPESPGERVPASILVFEDGIISTMVLGLIRGAL